MSAAVKHSQVICEWLTQKAGTERSGGGRRGRVIAIMPKTKIKLSVT